MADSTAMTIDFLRARLLSERSVSRAAKERADELAKSVAELEEQVRAVTEQRRQAERAAAEVLAILESHDFSGHLSDVDDDLGSDQDGDEEGEEDAKSRCDTARALGEEEPSGTAQPGGLSWKGRSVSPRKARQLKQKHRRSYFYSLSSSDSSPKYRMGQSCRKNKRRMEPRNGGSGRSASPEEGSGDVVAAESQKARQDGSDCTDDGQADMDGGDERSSGDGSGGQYVIRCEKDGEMERVLERQAELIGQYEEEEKAQREWEKQYNENRKANKGDAEVQHKPYQVKKGREQSNQRATVTDQQIHCDVEAKSCHKNLPSTSNPSAECLPNGSLSESLQIASQENCAQLREANDEPDHGRAQAASVSAQESSNTSTVTRQDQDRGDENSDGDSGCNTNARPREHYAIKAPLDGSPSSDTLNSKVSDRSSSHFHDHTDSQLDTQTYRPSSSSNVDVGSVLEALQRARISLRAKLTKPVPPNQVTLALPAPGDEHKEHDDMPANDNSNSYREELSSSSPARQEILALPAPEDYHESVALQFNDTGISVSGKLSSSSPRREEILALPAPGDDYRREIEDYIKIPVSTPGLFRLPTDSFPVDQTMFSRNACGSEFSLGAASSRHAVFASNPAATEVPTVSGGGSVFSAKQRCDLHSSALLSVPTSGRCSDIPRPDFTVGGTCTSLPFRIPGLKEDLRRGMPLGDEDLFMQRGIDYTISN
ncbi:uncharacterized protein LOC133924880 [Phragmites australis]|uniref:uncharacterized protein LOC133924880 n=1 Tax=Phragmites australis TaxID=29695 RepID=UPI002D7747AB|nr:uncharacterized protein LOC133924880 [Phragmites australis]